MSRPPQFASVAEPGAPRWRRWWLALLLLWGVQSAAMLTLWPEEQPRIERWLWSAVLPVSWALALALRLLAWQIERFGGEAHRRAQEATVQRWWRHRALGLPVEQVLLLGPAGDDQAHYQSLMANAPLPKPSTPADGAQPVLRCPLSLRATSERAPALGRHLARLALALPALAERWPQLRAIAWVGDTSSETAFVQMLASKGVVAPEARLPLRDLTDLDRLMDAFHHDCHDKADWLLFAGVVSVVSTDEPELPGEAGFLWLVSRQGEQLLHRGEYLLTEPPESPAELCEQVQRYAGLDAAPPACLALDQASQTAFVEGSWSAVEHQLAGQWGVLAELTPFIAMSLALLQAGKTKQPCGWLSQDAEQRLAIGVAVPHGNR